MDGSSKDLPKLPPPVVLFYDSALSFCFMFCYWIVSVERAPSIDCARAGALETRAWPTARLAHRLAHRTRTLARHMCLTPCAWR